MNSLEKRRLINRENLSQSQYLQSILHEAYSLALLTDAELENIQLRTLQLLARRTERFTGGESSSVKVETAQGIMQSIFYTIGLFLKSLPDPETAVSALKERAPEELYRLGQEFIDLQTKKAAQLLEAVQNNRIETENYAYNDTINNGIPLFFSNYDADFGAHDTPASIDYPVSNDKMELVGVEYIFDYLQKLFIENEFCSNFSSHDIRSILSSYDKNHRNLLLNIFEMVSTNALGCILAEKNVLLLSIAQDDRDYLQLKLGCLRTDELRKLLFIAAKHLCIELSISDTSLQNYLANAVLSLTPRVKHALETNRLESIFISVKKELPQPVVAFQDRKKMDDEAFRKIADEIRQCRHASDKAAIVLRDLQSIGDLVDLLEGSCIFGDEFYEIFKSLGDPELALLLRMLPTHVIDPDFHLTESQKEWHQRFGCFLENIEPARLARIRKKAEHINPGSL